MTDTDTGDRSAAAVLSPESDAGPLPSDSSPPADRAGARSSPGDRRRARRRARWRTLRAWAVVLLLVAGAVVVGIRQADQRLERRDHVALDEVALAAQPVDVVTTSAASVVEIAVVPRERVEAGDVVATIDAIRPAPGGGERLVRQQLVASIDGVVAGVPTNVGAALRPGGVVVRLYDPLDLRFVADLDLEQASRLEVGMEGRLTSDVAGSIDVTVASIETDLDGDDGPRRVAVELVAADADRLAGLLPGLVFDGYVDERTAP